MKRPHTIVPSRTARLSAQLSVKLSAMLAVCWVLAAGGMESHATPLGACPPADHPCSEAGGPGCTDSACCATVCDFDPFCCEVAWDLACVDSASLLCPPPPVPVNDECAGAIAITGTGVFDFDLTGATTGIMGPGCWSSTEAMESDVWFKWTCTCAGARFTTCGLSDLDTVIEVYPAWTGCPSDADDAICCNDDAIPLGSCGFQSDIPFCDTRCGEEYYIRIGVYPGTPAGSGEFAIVCEPPAFFCCGSPTAGSCFAAHASATCNDFDCCWAVCNLQPHCCQTEWDVACVKAAIEAVDCAWPIACPPVFPGPRVFVCRAGCVDDFALPPDPVQSANASCVPFDVVSVDSCVSHKFQSCWAADAACAACGPIAQAWLEIRYKVGPQSFPDLGDTISFLDQGTLVASAPPAPVPFNTPVTDIFDLSAVPGLFGGTTNILGSLADGELGILCGDDVTVDYATLTVIACPCSEFTEAGIVRDQLCDGGTSTSAGKPSAALTAFLCPVPPGLGCPAIVSAYDYQIPGVTVYDTFSPVPDCLADAALFINAKFPGGTAGAMVHVELDTTCGAQFAWSMSVADLAALGGYLLPDYYCSGWTLIILPLDALPTDLIGNTTSVLSQALDNRVDYAIGPGVIVDGASINYIYCCSFSGKREDIDGDGVVGGSDLGLLLSEWGQCGCECCDADLDLDGVVDGADIGQLLAGWGG